MVRNGNPISQPQAHNGGPDCASLDFDRIINSYSIHTTRARVNLEHGKSLKRRARKQKEKKATMSSNEIDDSSSNDDTETTLLLESDKKRGNFQRLDTLRAIQSILPSDRDDPFYHQNSVDSPCRTANISDGLGQPGIPESCVAQRLPKRRFQGPDMTNLTRWLFAVLIGLSVGLCTIVIVHFSEKLGTFRSNHVNHSLSLIYKTYFPYTRDETSEKQLDFFSFFNPANRFSFMWDFSLMLVRFVSLNMLLAVAAAAMTVFIAPGAGGSGIPEVAAYLNGVRVRSFANFNLFLVKIVGTILAVSSGLAIGPEGPLVHLGAVIGSSLTKTGRIEEKIRQFGLHHPNLSGCLGCYPEHKNVVDAIYEGPEKPKNSFCWKRSFFSKFVYYLSFFRNDVNRRDFIGIGSAAGFAAAFGAPIGGVLYMIEETSTFFAKNLLWKTLSATSIATFCIAVYHGGLSRFSVLTLSIGDKVEDSNFVLHVMVFVSIGVFGGLLGALYNSIIKRTNSFRKEIFLNPTISIRAKAILRISEVALLSFITSTAVFFIPLICQSWACRERDEELLEDDRSGDEYGQFACADITRKNELGRIMVGSRDEAIFDILTKTSTYDPRTLIIVAITFFTLQVLTQGVSLPSGIFMPTVLVGSSFGGWAGLILRDTFHLNVSPSVIALLGAAALLAGIQRSCVSLCVILMEGTGQTGLAIPIVITIVTATYIGNLFNHGIYEVLIHLKNYAVLDYPIKNLFMFDIFMTKDIMTSPVITLETIELAGNIEKILFNTCHNGFPVVKIDDDTGFKKFVGLVRRDQLLALLECSIFMDESLSTQNLRSSVKALEENDISDFLKSFRNDSETDVFDSFNLGGINFENDGHGLESNALHIRDDRFPSLVGYKSSVPRKNNENKRQSAIMMFLEDSVSDVPFGSKNRGRGVKEEFEWLNDNLVQSGTSDTILTFGLDESLPMEPETTKTKEKSRVKGRRSVVKKNSGTTLWDKEGTLVITLDKEDRNKLVNIQAVMNRGAYSVHEGSPLSSALLIFTKIGLRHLTVLGGETGGEVVGILTRKNLTTEYLEEKTGYKLH